MIEVQSVQFVVKGKPEDQIPGTLLDKCQARNKKMAYPAGSLPELMIGYVIEIPASFSRFRSCPRPCDPLRSCA